MAESANGQDKANLEFWLALQVGKKDLSCGKNFPHWSHKKKFAGNIVNSLLTNIFQSRWLDIALQSFFQRFQPLFKENREYILAFKALTQVP